MSQNDQISRKEANLLGAGLKSDLVKKVLKKDLSLSKIKQMPKKDLEKIFTDTEVEDIDGLKRKPIPPETIEELIKRCHWKCCLCEEYSEQKPIIIHHIEEHSKSQDDSYDNLVVLCLNHHAEVHSTWTMSRHPWPEELIREKKALWEKAISDYIAGRHPLPSKKQGYPEETYHDHNPRLTFTLTEFINPFTDQFHDGPFSFQITGFFMNQSNKPVIISNSRLPFRATSKDSNSSFSFLDPNEQNPVLLNPNENATYTRHFGSTQWSVEIIVSATSQIAEFINIYFEIFAVDANAHQFREMITLGKFLHRPKLSNSTMVLERLPKQIVIQLKN